MGKMALISTMVLLSLSYYCSSTKLVLHRATPFNQNLEVVVLRDLSRKSHLVGDYNLSGDFSFALIYYTKILLGSPPQEFHVQVDSGSDLLWVSCISCATCPYTSALDIDLHFYNASNSSTASMVLCSDRKHCSLCRLETNSCSYQVSYGDGSETSGELVTDLLHINSTSGAWTNSSFPVTFGTHYNLQLLSISVGGKIFAIASKSLTTKEGKGITIDSGTTLAYLVQDIYDPFITAINTYVSNQAKPHLVRGYLCYQAATRATDFFPQVTLSFADDANMVLKPEDYLIQSSLLDAAGEWCMGFQKVPNGELSILGELVLRDKIVVNDLYKQKVGWTTYFNCSSSVKINSTYGFTNGGQSNCPKHNLLIHIIITTVIMLVL